jgi:hypothetical protein
MEIDDLLAGIVGYKSIWKFHEYAPVKSFARRRPSPGAQLILCHVGVRASVFEPGEIPKSTSLSLEFVELLFSHRDVAPDRTYYFGFCPLRHVRLLRRIGPEAATD